MKTETFIMNTQYTILLLTLFIYVMTMVSFYKAKIKYSGGKIGELINIVFISVTLLFISDYVAVFSQMVPENIIDILRILFRTVAFSFLAFGGSRIAAR